MWWIWSVWDNSSFAVWRVFTFRFEISAFWLFDIYWGKRICKIRSGSIFSEFFFSDYWIACCHLVPIVYHSIMWNTYFGFYVNNVGVNWYCHCLVIRHGCPILLWNQLCIVWKSADLVVIFLCKKCNWALMEPLKGKTVILHSCSLFDVDIIVVLELCLPAAAFMNTWSTVIDVNCFTMFNLLHKAPF